MLQCYRVFFFSTSVCNNCFKSSNFEIPILKHSKSCHFSGVQNVKFSFLFYCLEHIMNPVYSLFTLLFFYKIINPTCNYHIMLINIQADDCQEQTSNGDPLTRWISSSYFLGFHSDSTGRSRHCRSMAGAQNGMCELA
jgi:hypothetical protein